MNTSETLLLIVSVISLSILFVITGTIIATLAAICFSIVVLMIGPIEVLCYLFNLYFAYEGFIQYYLNCLNIFLRFVWKIIVLIILLVSNTIKFLKKIT